MRVCSFFFIYFILIKLTGVWDEGNISTGKWIFPNGTTFEGSFKYNKPIGEGFKI